MTREQAIEVLDRDSNAINHLISNDDGTYSIMFHIVCEHCDYCDSQGDCRGMTDPVAVPAKPDPYELNDARWGPT